MANKPRESVFQKKLINKLKARYPEAIILKNDANYLQGFPDIIILNGLNWAVLEAKRRENAPHQPNQDYYVNKCNKMSFGAFVYPENERKVLHDIQRALENRRTTRRHIVRIEI